MWYSLTHSTWIRWSLVKNRKRTSNVEYNKRKRIHKLTINKIIWRSSKSNVGQIRVQNRKKRQSGSYKFHRIQRIINKNVQHNILRFYGEIKGIIILARSWANAKI